MASSAYRVVILVIFVGFLAVQPEKVYALRSIDLALRWHSGHVLFLKNSRILLAVATKELHTKPSLAPAPSIMVDPNQSSKRRVRRGSDPIHNRC